MSEDYILIGGGLLIALVIMHGLWLAWRARQDPLPLDISSDIPDDEFELDALAADFPNGGARVVEGAEHAAPTQRPLAFGRSVPVLMEVVDEDATSADGVDDAESGVETGNGSANPEEDWHGSPPEPIVAQVSDSIMAVREQSGRLRSRSGKSDGSPGVADASQAGELQASRTPRDSRKDRGDGRREAEAPRGDAAVDAEKGEILAINVLARGNRRFNGSDLWAAFRRNGLTFGDMNIFHRLNPVTRTPQYSVANAVEPGTFDLSNMESMKTPGACFFLRLPGPSEPAAVFDDMLRVARDIGDSLDGDLKDENFSVLTGQTEEHYRQRIAEFSRKRMFTRY